MASLGVGKEILSYCNKCKLTLAHIIVTMKTLNEADKVMCKTCKGTHAFKDPSTKTSKRVTALKPTGARKTQKTSEPVADIWSREMYQSKATPSPYSIKAKYQKGDVITHPTFGDGIVEKNIDSNKIEVLFKDDFRILVHNK